jgi:hypothetical protein
MSIKETYIGLDGKMTVEYDDNTTRQVNLAGAVCTDPVTGQLDSVSRDAVRDVVGG